MAAEESPLFTSSDYNRHFDADAYLEHFYGAKAMREGMRLLLFVLPNAARKIEQLMGSKPQTLLDIGSGPTIYVPLCFREHVEEVHLADYAEQSCMALESWMAREEGKSFDWSAVAKAIAGNEGNAELVMKVSPSDQGPAKYIQKMEDEARRIIRLIRRCDVLSPHLRLEGAPEDRQLPAETTYDIVTTIFCLESACSDYEQYELAMANIAARRKRVSQGNVEVRNGGFLVLGSVLEDYTYEFADRGREHRFELLYLTEERILDTLRNVGLTVLDPTIVHNGAIAILARKL